MVAKSAYVSRSPECSLCNYQDVDINKKNVDMQNFPKGNDLIVRWSILYPDGSIFPVSNYSYELSYSTGRGVSVVSDSSISVNANIITWRFSGAEQAFFGKYSLTLKLYLDGKLIATVSKNNAFELTRVSSFGLSDLNITSYCDAISVQDVITQATKALDTAISTKKQLEVLLPNGCVRLQSPNGTAYLLSVDDSGNVKATPIK